MTQGHRPLLRDRVTARIVIREMMHIRAEGMADTLCFMPMPDHLHWLMTLRNGELSGVMRMLKGRTARAIGQSVWQPNFYDHAVRKEEDLRAVARFIVANPLRASVVEKIGNYPWWDAIWLEGMLSS